MGAKQLFVYFLVVTVVVSCFGHSRRGVDVDDDDDDNDTGNINENCTHDSNCTIKQDLSDINKTACGLCGDNITVTLRIENDFNGTESIPQEVNVTAPQRELIYFLQEAADIDPAFKFTGVYFSGLGYYISKLNGTEANTDDRTYWQILDGRTLTPYNLGVSSYVPEDGEISLFLFTDY